MKKLLLILFCLLALKASSQIVTYAGQQSGYIKTDDLLMDSVLKVENDEGTIVGFTVSMVYKGYSEDYLSFSNKFTLGQKSLIQKGLVGTNIYIEEIKVKMKNDSVRIAPSLVFIKDGPCASILHSEEYYYSNDEFAYLLKHPKIYAYPLINSNDSTQFKITSFKIKSVQPNLYYQFESNSEFLTAEMKDFIKKAYISFSISEIKAVDKSNKLLELRRITISPNNIDLLIKTKNQLLSTSKINLISANSRLKVESFFLIINKHFTKPEENYLESKNDVITPEMKKFIKNAKDGDILPFRLECINAKGESETLEISVKIIE